MRGGERGSCIGTASNFGYGISKWGALYVALGTFSTAGTGTPRAQSDAARISASAQLVVDVLFLTVAVALVVARLIAADEAQRGRTASST